MGWMNGWTGGGAWQTLVGPFGLEPRRNALSIVQTEQGPFTSTAHAVLYRDSICVGVVISVKEGWSSCCCLAFGLENRSIQGSHLRRGNGVLYAFQAVTSILLLLLLDSHTEGELCTIAVKLGFVAATRVGCPPCPEILLALANSLLGFPERSVVGNLWPMRPSLSPNRS